MVLRKTSTPKNASTPKRTSRAKTKKKSLVRADGDRCFWVNHGPVVCDLHGLKGALRGMSVEQYSHHAGDGKNDFAVWSVEVCGDPEVSARLRRAKTKEEAAMIIEQALAAYEF